jgi:hypothetical protein
MNIIGKSISLLYYCNSYKYNFSNENLTNLTIMNTQTLHYMYEIRKLIKLRIHSNFRVKISQQNKYITIKTIQFCVRLHLNAVSHAVKVDIHYLSLVI